MPRKKSTISNRNNNKASCRKNIKRTGAKPKLNYNYDKNDALPTSYAAQTLLVLMSIANMLAGMKGNSNLNKKISKHMK